MKQAFEASFCICWRKSKVIRTLGLHVLYFILLYIIILSWSR